MLGGKGKQPNMKEQGKNSNKNIDKNSNKTNRDIISAKNAVEFEDVIEKQRSLNKFNAVTTKSTPENQNQQHNVKKEGIQPINQKR